MLYLSRSNTKLLKSEKKGWETYGLSLSPYKNNSYGVNLCAKATSECAKLCLFGAGRGKFENVRSARIKKADEFIKNPSNFTDKLRKDLEYLERRRVRLNNNIAVRLNVISDVPWENMKLYDVDKNLMELFPNLIFYDYTKIPNRFKQLPKNYNLTFSFSGENWSDCKNLLEVGHNVSVVFGGDLPQSYKGFQVINGDESDARFLDPKGVIVGLKYKKVKSDLDITKTKFIVS